MDSDLDKDNVHGWLVGLDEGLPLDGQWTLHNPGDPVEELYKNVKMSSPEELPIWIGVAMAMTLVCVALVVLAALGKIYKWQPGYGMDFDLWAMTKGTLAQIHRRMCEKSVKKVSEVSNYEEAIDRFGAVRIYEGGKRIEELPSSTTKDLQSTCSHEPGQVEYTGSIRDLSDAANHKSGMRSPSPTLLNPPSYGWKNDKNSILQNLITKLGFNKKQWDKKRRESESERLKNMRAYQNRPLPTVTEQFSPVTNRQKLSESHHNSPFLKTNIFTPNNELPANKRSWIQKLGKSKQGDDFKKVEQILLRNSVENINSVTHNSPDHIDAVNHFKHAHNSSEIKNKTMPIKKVCTVKDLDIDSRSIRSQSMDDAYEISRRRKNILNYGIRRNSFSDHITINEIYAALSDQTEAPLGTYGTWEKDGYLQLPYMKHCRPLSGEEAGILLQNLKEDDITRLCSITDDTNPYHSIKSRLSEGNLYASIKGKGFILNIPCDTNLYDSIKGVPVVAPLDNKHTYAEVFDRKTNIEEVTVDVRKRPIPIPTEINTNGTNKVSIAQTPFINGGQGNSIHKYEKIDNIQTSEEKHGNKQGGNEKEVDGRHRLMNNSGSVPLQGKGYTGIYMKFGEVVFTKI